MEYRRLFIAVTAYQLFTTPTSHHVISLPEPRPRRHHYALSKSLPLERRLSNDAPAARSPPAIPLRQHHAWFDGRVVGILRHQTPPPRRRPRLNIRRADACILNNINTNKKHSWSPPQNLTSPSLPCRAPMITVSPGHTSPRRRIMDTRITIASLTVI